MWRVAFSAEVQQLVSCKRALNRAMAQAALLRAAKIAAEPASLRLLVRALHRAVGAEAITFQAFSLFSFSATLATKLAAELMFVLLFKDPVL